MEIRGQESSSHLAEGNKAVNHKFNPAENFSKMKVN
jgi:hypothetical protein